MSAFTRFRWKEERSEMRLFWTPASPFVRKVMVILHELGLADQVEIVPTVWPHEWATHTVKFDPDFIKANPVGRIPALVTDSGAALCESNLIFRYLAAKLDGQKLIPEETDENLSVLRLWGIGDGALEAMIATRAEALRAASERSEDFMGKQMDRIIRCFDSFDVALLNSYSEPTIAHIIAGIACGYMDFRFPSQNWRSDRPLLAGWYGEFSLRPSMMMTRPKETPQK
jgi:glutathione S-transferase